MNSEILQKNIQLKNSQIPMFWNGTNIILNPVWEKKPFPQLWKGNYQSIEPHISTREAGFLPLYNIPETAPPPIINTLPNLDFVSGTTTRILFPTSQWCLNKTI